MKAKLSDEIKQSANRIMTKYLSVQKSLPEITDAVYAMVRVVEIKFEIQMLLRKKIKAQSKRK